MFAVREDTSEASNLATMMAGPEGHCNDRADN